MFTVLLNGDLPRLQTGVKNKTNNITIEVILTNNGLKANPFNLSLFVKINFINIGIDNIVINNRGENTIHVTK